MGIKFYTERVTFTDVTVSNGSISKEISHEFDTTVLEGSATLSGFFIAYPGDRREVEFVGARVFDIKKDNRVLKCTIELQLEDGGTEEEGGEVSPARSIADVLFIAYCE